MNPNPSFPRCAWCVRVQIVKHEEYCPYLESIDPTVRCVHESKILPGVSYHSLKAASPNLIRFQGQLFDRVRWYFQQYLKLGVALHLEGLSERYLVWDADSIPIKPFPLLADDGRVQLCATPSSKKAHDFGTQGRASSIHGWDPRVPCLREHVNEPENGKVGFRAHVSRTSPLPLLHVRKSRVRRGP